jgi:ABC-type transport system involved in cytochrome bd biosynthesis fused ATPase/permease subunit
MASEHDTSTGQIVNLISNDAQRMQNFMAYVHNVWSAPFQIIFAFALLINFLGPSALVGLAVLLISLPVKGLFVARQALLRKFVVGRTDVRLKVINDVMQGIRVIKFYGWATSFLEKITKVRADEMAGLRSYIKLESINNTMWNLTPMLVSLTTFATYAYDKGDLKASIVFTAVLLFQRVRFPVVMLPVFHFI